VNAKSRGKLSRRGALKLIGASSLGLGLSGALGYTYCFRVEPFWLAIEQVQIGIADLADGFNGFKLVCLSDFHHEPGDAIGYVDRLVERTNRLNPDVICLLGDYVYSDAHAIEPLSNSLSNLHAVHGVYAVLGNHDYWTDPEFIARELRSAGIELLVNQGVTIERAGKSIYLVGMDDGWSGEPDLKRALVSAPVDAPTIVLFHEPDFADSISVFDQVDLQISGHSHGGQVKPFFIETPFRPAYARRYSAGLYDVGGMQLYVTRGVGTIPPRARFNCRPEITELVLSRPS
jgi:hypothetical protein